MRFDLSDPFQRQQAQARLDHLAQKGAIVELTEKKARGLSQNAYLHVILAFFATKVGETEEIVKRQYYKIHCNPELFIRTKTDAVLHHQVKFLRSSSTLTSEEMTLSIERFRNFASSEAGIYIPSPEEHVFIAQMENEIEQAKQFL